MISPYLPIYIYICVCNVIKFGLVIDSVEVADMPVRSLVRRMFDPVPLRMVVCASVWTAGTRAVMSFHVSLQGVILACLGSGPLSGTRAVLEWILGLSRTLGQRCWVYCILMTPEQLPIKSLDIKSEFSLFYLLHFLFIL